MEGERARGGGEEERPKRKKEAVADVVREREDKALVVGRLLSPPACTQQGEGMEDA